MWRTLSRCPPILPHIDRSTLFDGKLNLTMCSCVSTTHFTDSDKMDGIGSWNA